jgi:hypothetical protein
MRIRVALGWLIALSGVAIACSSTKRETNTDQSPIATPGSRGSSAAPRTPAASGGSAAGAGNESLDGHIIYENDTLLNTPSLAWRFFKQFW